MALQLLKRSDYKYIIPNFNIIWYGERQGFNLEEEGDLLASPSHAFPSLE